VIAADPVQVASNVYTEEHSTENIGTTEVRSLLFELK
jgi:hypothetical protein